MSRVCLTTADLLTLRAALGHAITAHPAPTSTFPFAPESTEKLASLLDSLLTVPTVPGTTFTLEVVPDRPPNNANLGQLLDDVAQQGFGVTSTGSGDLTETAVLVHGHMLGPLRRSSLPTTSRGSTPDSDIWGSNASTFRDSSPAPLFGGEAESTGRRRVLDSEWDDDEVVGGRVRYSKCPRLNAISEEEEEEYLPGPQLQDSFRRPLHAPDRRLRSAELSPLKQALLASTPASDTNSTYPFSFTMNVAGETGHGTEESHVSSRSSPSLYPPPPLIATSPPAFSPTSPTTSAHGDPPTITPPRHKPNNNLPRLTIRIPPRTSTSTNQSEQQLDDAPYRAGSVELFNWIHDGNPPPLNAENQRLAGNADWLRPGQVGPGGVVKPPKPPKPPCKRGGCSLLSVSGRRLTGEERRRMSRMGPEGMGDVNEGDDLDAYQEDNEEQPADPTSSSQNDTLSTMSPPPGYLILNNGEARPEIQVLNRRASHFLLTLAAGCRECLPGSTTSTTMVANPLDIFRALKYGFMPGTLSPLTTPAGRSFADQAQLCTVGFTPGQDDPDCQHLPVNFPKDCTLRSLTSVVTRMIDAEVLEAIAQLIYWVNAMHFAALIMKEVKRTKRSREDLFKMVAEDMGRVGHAKVGVPLLKRYYHDGTVVAMLAAAGSMYLVIVMACCRVRQDIRAINFEFFGHITRELRMPHHSLFFTKLTNYIIPGIARLMKVEPLTMSRLASDVFMVAGGKLEIDCTDLCESDEFFENFALMEPVNDRDKEAWKEGMVANPQGQRLRLETVNSLLSQPIRSSDPLQLPPILSIRRSGSAPPPSLPAQPQAFPASPRTEKLPPLDFSWEKAEFKGDTHIIDTDFSFELNRTVGYKQSNEKLRYNYTQRQRKATLNAVEALDVDQLRELLVTQLTDGKRKNQKTWVEMDTAILKGNMLRINDMAGGALVTFLPPIPTRLIDDFFDSLRVLFPDFRVTDTKKEGSLHTYPAVHCDVYGRYTNRGDGVPDFADPSSIQKEGKECLNTCRNLPRTSAEWNKDSELFVHMQEAAAPIFN